jgi:hypothetical protein
VLRGGVMLRGGVLQGAAPQIGEHFDWHSSAHPAGIGELAVIREVAQQERPQMGPCSFQVGPANDDELLAVQPFGFTP